jgi:hypothetical protein
MQPLHCCLRHAHLECQLVRPDGGFDDLAVARPDVQPCRVVWAGHLLLAAQVHGSCQTCRLMRTFELAVDGA